MHCVHRVSHRASGRGRVSEGKDLSAVCELCAKYLSLVDEHRILVSRFRIDRLSAREREVFLLIGLGLSNADLVKQLQISERTVKAHVSRIIAKLGLSRVQVATIAAAYRAKMCT
jgi:DNA-binding CsgD family transcriptional regulator